MDVESLSVITKSRSGPMLRGALIAGMLACCAGTVPGQAPPAAQSGAAALPSFAVAVIKPGKPDSTGFAWRNTPDGISFTGMPMQQILCAAFNLEDDRVVGLPAWIREQRFDIEARVDPADLPQYKDLNYHQRYAMIVPVLSDRFNLKFHHESRVLPVYVLTIAKGGSKLTGTKAGPDGKEKDSGWSMGNGQMDAHATTIESLIQALSPQVGHTILDKTGLTGHYDFKLRWTPDDAPPMSGADGTNAPGSDASAPPLFTALQEQLGLKLESRKEPVDVIVIDHIEKPSPN